jgi:hypothetical protein
MICPVCEVDKEPATVQGPVAICGACGFTCHIDEAGTVTRATLRQIESLTDDQITALRVKKSAVRPKR